jgi:hypothetical protein
MILQLRQMRLTDASTFMVNSYFQDFRRSQPSVKLHLLRRDSLLGAEYNSRAAQIVWGELNGHFISRQNTNVMHTHLPGNETQNHMTVFELDPERRVREIFNNLPLHFD